MMHDADPMRVLLVNENIGGHATMHLGVRFAIQQHDDVEADFIDVPQADLLRRVVRLPVPFLARLDLDLQPFRAQLALSHWVRRQLDRHLAQHEVDVLHIHSQHAALLSVNTMRSVPTVVTTDGAGTQLAGMVPYREPAAFTEFRAWVVRRAFEQRVFDAAHRVVAWSDWAAEALRREYGVTDERLRVIRFGIVVPDLVADHRADRPVEITWIDNHLKRKGGYRLLRLFRERFRDRCILNIVTPEKLEPEPGVRVHNGLWPGDSRLFELLRRTAVLAFPSDMDAYGFAVLEAMAVGVPVVGFRLHAVPELIVDGTTGFTVDVDDRQLAGALERLVDDAELRSRMGRAARQRVLDHFDAADTTAQLVEVLREAKTAQDQLRTSQE